MTVNKWDDEEWILRIVGGCGVKEEGDRVDDRAEDEMCMKDRQERSKWEW